MFCLQGTVASRLRKPNDAYWSIVQSDLRLNAIPSNRYNSVGPMQPLYIHGSLPFPTMLPATANTPFVYLAKEQTVRLQKSIAPNRDRFRRYWKYRQWYDLDMDALRWWHQNPIHQPEWVPLEPYDAYWPQSTQPTDESMSQLHCTTESSCPNCNLVFAELQRSMEIHLKIKLIHFTSYSIHASYWICHFEWLII